MILEIQILRMFPGSFLYERVSEYPGVSGSDTPSILDLPFMCRSLELENLRYETPLWERDEGQPELNCLVSGEITQTSEKKSSPKRK